MRSRISILTATLVVASGCHDAPADPSRRLAADPQREGQAEAQLATLAWYPIDVRLATQNAFLPARRIRAFAYLTLAQYRAAAAAEDATGGQWPSYVSAAVAGASAAVLTYFFPADAALVEDALREAEHLAAANPHSGFAAGADFGRAVAAPVIARAETDSLQREELTHAKVGGQPSHIF